MQVFFYGLFMDESILRKNGLQPSDPRIGYLDHYVLKIGNRASLLPKENERSWGVVMDVDQKAIQELYAEPSVADYVPEEVSITLNNGEVVPASCYNLPLELMTGKPNREYATALYELGKKLGLPDDYLEKIMV